MTTLDAHNIRYLSPRRLHRIWHGAGRRISSGGQAAPPNCARSKILHWASPMFHVGITMVLAGHPRRANSIMDWGCRCPAEVFTWWPPAPTVLRRYWPSWDSCCSWYKFKYSRVCIARPSQRQDHAGPLLTRPWGWVPCDLHHQGLRKRPLADYHETISPWPVLFSCFNPT